MVADFTRTHRMSSEAKRTVKLGYKEYCAIPEDGKRHEIINGEHFVNPAPDTYHQTLSRRIQFQLYSQIELTGLGQVFDAPCDALLSEHDIVQPDLIIVLHNRGGIITRANIQGTPDLVVEILSPSTSANDRHLKKELYCRCKIAEYWIVDPVDHEVQQFVLRDEEYASLGRHTERVELQSVPGVSVNLSEVW